MTLSLSKTHSPIDLLLTRIMIIQTFLKHTAVYSGGGNDTVTVLSRDGKDVFAGHGNDVVTNPYGDIWGGAGNDTIEGGDGNNKIRGNDGNDIIRDGAGDDDTWWCWSRYFFMGTGSDRFDGGEGLTRYMSIWMSITL